VRLAEKQLSDQKYAPVKCLYVICISGSCKQRTTNAHSYCHSGNISEFSTLASPSGFLPRQSQGCYNIVKKIPRVQALPV
jgi:hypothetical protein